RDDVPLRPLRGRVVGKARTDLSQDGWDRARRIQPYAILEPRRLREDLLRRLDSVRLGPPSVPLYADPQRRPQREPEMGTLESTHEVLDLRLPVEVPIEHHRRAPGQHGLGASGRNFIGPQ